jgi:cytochrome c oxidase subunit 2
VNHVALGIAIGYSAVVILSVVVAVALWRSTAGGPKPISAHLAERERTWLGIVGAILFALLITTIWFTPYGQSTPANAQVVHVTGQQFAWTLSPGHVRAGKAVEFLATSKDVSHGFGLYDPDGNFVAQAQVVPGKTQKLVHTFSKPGRYQILCLEFCGLDHHLMQTVLLVTR